MRGRFEQPRNSRSAGAQNSPSQNRNSYGEAPYEEPRYEQGDYGENPYNDGYGQDSYQQDGYSQNSYQDNGYQQNPYANNGYNGNPYGNGRGYQPASNGGYGQPPRMTPPQQEGSGFGWGVLGFFFVPVGLILALVWRKTKPRASKASGIGALIGFIVTVLLVIGLVVGGKMYVDGMLGKVNYVEMEKPVYTQPAEEEVVPEITEAPVEMTEAPTEAPTEPPHATREDYVNFLVVGQAGRDGEEERFADTMMVFTLNKFDKSITVTSLLRDSFVQPPPFKGHNFGQIKLTTVYHLGSHYDNGNVAGSMELMNQTLNKNFGLEIDHNVEIDFDVFLQIVDTLGGVDIEINEPEAAYLNKELKKVSWKTYDEMVPGEAHLDGWAALVYARMRKAEGDGDSDIKRTARQRKMIEAVMGKVKGMSLGDVQNLANAVLPMITTNMSKDEITDTMMTLLPMLPELKLITGGTCPINYSGAMVDIYKDGMPHSVLKFNAKETSEAMREITLGEKSGSAEK